MVLEHTQIKPDEVKLHRIAAVELAEYESDANLFDLIINDVPYIFGAEDYQSNDDRDLCKVKDLNAFNERMEICLKNMMRLIKTSNWKERVFHPIIMKVGSGRRNSNVEQD